MWKMQEKEPLLRSVAWGTVYNEMQIHENTDPIMTGHSINIKPWDPTFQLCLKKIHMGDFSYLSIFIEGFM